MTSLKSLNRGWSKSELVQILECDEFYQRLRRIELAVEDRKAIQEFVFQAMKPNEWRDFLTLCSANELNPHEEIRDLIYFTCAKILRQTP